MPVDEIFHLAVQVWMAQRGENVRDLKEIERGLRLRAFESEKRRERYVPSKLRLEVLASGDCVYCGDTATQVDHVVPVSRGGTGDRGNLAPACRRCNHEKHWYTVEEWRDVRLEVGMCWPPKPESELQCDQHDQHGDGEGVVR